MHLENEIRICPICKSEFTHPTRKTCSAACGHKSQGLYAKQRMLHANPMKQLETRKKASKSRKRLMESADWRKVVSEYTRKAWADGKYDGVKVGCCNWYEHITPDNATVKLQGTWEVIFARYLDRIGVKYLAHQGRISYVDKDGVARSYYPDFFVPETNTYYDVKGAFFDDIQRDKISFIRKSNPDIRLEIFNAQRFSDVGIDIDKESMLFRQSLTR